MIFGRRHRVDQADLQGNVLCGYGLDFRCGRHLLVTIEQPAAGRRFIGELASLVTTAIPWGRAKPRHTLNVAVSYAGLKALGLPGSIRKSFPREFRQGMKKRALWLGDTGRSDPERWEQKLRPVERHHLLLSVMAQDPDILAERLNWLEARIGGDPGLSEAYSQDVEINASADRRIASREHFGFTDGFSQPAIRGKAGPHTKKGMGTRRRFGRWSALAPGEFVLGYAGEDKLQEPAPTAPLGRSGSYTVFRKLYQDVYEFDCYIEERLKRFNGRDPLPGLAEPDELRREHMAAKMLGRWMDGTSLVRSSTPTAAQEGAERNPWYQKLAAKLRRDPRKWLHRKYIQGLNRFDYASDPNGYRCPLGAHVRRANPRDAFGWQGRLTKRHRIIRRGLPYGKPVEGRKPLRGPPLPAPAYNGDRGLVFVCHQASIARQFEVIQARWLNDGDAFWLGEEKDFIAAGRQPEAAAAPLVTAAAGALAAREPGGAGEQAGDGATEAAPAPAGEGAAQEQEESPVAVAVETLEQGAEDGEADDEDRPGRMTIQGAPPCFLEPQPYFVQLRGGGYFFTPGLAALRALSRPFWL